MDPYGLKRVVGQPGVLPQQAQRLDPSLPLRDDELLIDVDVLNIDAASFRQIERTAGNDPLAIAAQSARSARRTPRPARSSLARASRRWCR